MRSQKNCSLIMTLGERSYFALTLDNGLHCVTTAWLELGKTAPIGQEFELVVLNDLEFQLTLQTKLEEPKIKPVVESPTKSVKAPKTSTFSRVFASPKKRKELELRQQEEAQRVARQQQEDAQAKRRSTQPTAWDLLHSLVAKDGSFARSYISISDHESKAYGRPYIVDVPCFNEWATEEKPIPSVKSKHSTMGGGVQNKPPYRIGKLELQLLYIPKPKGSTDDDMPKSMNACIRDLAEAEVSIPKSWEGHLSQQGGDCPVRPRLQSIYTSANTSPVLAPTLLQARRLKAHRLPRSHPATPSNHQPCQSQQTDRRQVRPHAQRNLWQRRFASQISLCRGRRGLHVRRRRFPCPLCKWRDD